MYFFKYFILFYFIYLFIFTLKYCIGFAIHQHESAMGVHAPNRYAVFLFAYSTLLLLKKIKKEVMIVYMTLVDHLTFWVLDYLPAKYVTGLL